ncbi:O-antigen translocase [Pedobacter miscanthi]|uniref:O-antigen translocase n=1 Tax=Pedobacter miscanthi TaxID=2259170 RepID=A0A366KPV0_9SPHI|nr:O-antigen translocase [Pedobacter miscanthi]RBQ03560.1 O-antigen translocase [Pedobacter miscanthi]
MKLVRTVVFSGIVTFVRISSGFIASKIVAVLTGPVGVALVGSFSNFITIILTFANGAINSGVIKYTAEYKTKDTELKNLFSTSLLISIGASIITGLIVLLSASQISNVIFSDKIYVNPVRVLAIGIIFYSLNSLLLAILNGMGEIKTYTTVNSLGSLFALLFTGVLVYFFKIVGALYALGLSQSVVFFFTIFLVFKRKWFSKDYFSNKWDKAMSIKLSRYSLMAIITALTVPVSQIFIRNIIISTLGLNDAGYWQAMMRISDGYLMVVTTSLSTYYLPKLSALNDDAEIRQEILGGYKIIMPFVFLGCILIYFCRILIIHVLYTPDFLTIENLFVWQLMGDFLKLASWILAYLMLARGMIKPYIVTEIIFSALYVIFGFILINKYGLIGSTYAFALTYLLYLVVMLLIFRKLLFNIKAKINI